MSRLRLMLVMALGAVAAVFVACGSDDEESSDTDSGSSGGVETISMVQPIPGDGSVFFYPFLVGEELGFYEDEGVEVEYQSAGSDLPLPAFVANGDADIALAGSDETLAAVSQGGDLRNVYDDYRAAADVISVLDDSDIQDVSGLEGATVGVAGQDDRVVTETALDIAGVDPSSVQIVTIGEGGPTTAQAITGGRVDAYAAGISDKAITETLGDITLRDILPEEIRDRPAASMVVAPETIESRRDALVGFLRAWAMATYAAEVNPEVVAAISRERVPQEWENEDIAQSILDFSIVAQDPGEELYGSQRLDAWETTQDQLIAVGEYTEPVDIETLLDDALLEEVNDFDRAAVEKAVEDWAAQNLE